MKLHRRKKKPIHIKYDIDIGINIISMQNDDYYITKLILKKAG